MKKKLFLMMVSLCAAVGSVARADLLARYTFDDGTASDSVGTYHATLTGGATIVEDAERGNALLVNGTVTGTGVIAWPTIATGLSEYTIALWLKMLPEYATSAHYGNMAIHASVVWNSTSTHFSINSGRVTVDYNGGVIPEPTGALQSPASPLMAGGGWTHVAITASQSAALTAIYINGEMVASREQTMVSGLTLGNAQSSWGTARYFAGWMDDIRMYDHALTAEEVGQAMSGTGVTNLDPPSGAIRVPIDQILSWDPPSQTDPNFVVVGYDVYFDPNQTKVAAGDPSVKVASNQAATTYDPFGAADMPYLAKYFWRVDVVGQYDYLDDPNVFEGVVYSFTTRSLVPEIIAEPVNQVRGSANGKPDAVLSVAALNATDYQWYKEDVLIPDATEATLTIAGVEPGDEGQYYCVVSSVDSPVEVESDRVWVEYARLTSQWAFENDYTDSVGGHDGALVSDPNSIPGFAPGRIGDRALSLDGADDYLILPSEALSKAGTEMTFAFWARNNAPTAGTVVLYAYEAANPGNRIINIHAPWSNNNAYMDVSNAAAAGTYDRVGAANAVVTAGDPYWIHWIFTKDAETGTMRIYRDGVRIGQATAQARRYYGADHLQLGANRSATDVPGQFFNGLIDDLRIYNYAVDEVEAAYLYHDATGQSVCINNLDPVVARYDFNGNCKIDLADFAVLAANWLYCQQVPDCVERP
ncbi:MAG: hypothetical protein IH624_17825 [Phycisphaerae bacterium]|nr:hypothetical protein [Phycisphaerae bacterium]